MAAMRDAFGRKLEYLRLSVTDRCNFRCVYCLPEGCPKGSGEEPLSVEEIERLVRAFAALGVWKVRLTGGEPTLRPDIADIVRAVAGVAALNVSVDSLDAERFARVTGGRLERVMAGVEAALATGIPSVKVNAVLMAGMEDELDGFLDRTRRAAVTVRFIELMETGDNGDFFARHHLSTDVVRRRLEERGWVRRVRDASDGPAVTYAHGDHTGRVGLIAPYAPGFCDSCNRVRVSSTGGLHLCLFGDRAIPLRHYVRDGHHHRDLVELIAGCVAEKPESHLLRLGSSGSTATLAQLGG